jgi:pimeloyl-ACP methyl ester carboxylesterase
MLEFQPAGFEQRSLNTSLGQMVYAVPNAEFWAESSSQPVVERSPIVFLHSLGGGSSAYEWSKVYPAFAATHRAIAPDLVGWGDSAHPARNYVPQDYFDLIETVLEDVARAPAWVAASSLTAGLTIRLAIQKPHLFRGLFLVAPSGYRDFGADYDQGIAAQLTRIPGLDRLIYTLGAANELAVRTFLEQILFGERSRLSQETVSAYLASALKPNAEYAVLSSLRGDLCFDLSQYVEQLQVPSVWVWGARSRFSGPEQGRRLAQLNPAFVQSLYVIPDAGVLPHLETPAIVTGLLSGFTREHV